MYYGFYSTRAGNRSNGRPGVGAVERRGYYGWNGSVGVAYIGGEQAVGGQLWLNT